MTDSWVDGSLEAGSDDAGAGAEAGDATEVGGQQVTEQSGAELGLADGEPNSFEPEEADPSVQSDAGED